MPQRHVAIGCSSLKVSPPLVPVPRSRSESSATSSRLTGASSRFSSRAWSRATTRSGSTGNDWTRWPRPRSSAFAVEASMPALRVVCAHACGVPPSQTLTRGPWARRCVLAGWRRRTWCLRSGWRRATPRWCDCRWAPRRLLTSSPSSRATRPSLRSSAARCRPTAPPTAPPPPPRRQRVMGRQRKENRRRRPVLRELELIQSHMAQQPVLRVEVGYACCAISVAPPHLFKQACLPLFSRNPQILRFGASHIAHGTEFSAKAVAVTERKKRESSYRKAVLNWQNDWRLLAASTCLACGHDGSVLSLAISLRLPQHCGISPRCGRDQHLCVASAAVSMNPCDRSPRSL